MATKQFKQFLNSQWFDESLFNTSENIVDFLHI